MISVLILTLNEAENLPHCLKSISWSDDIVVFDSFSTDETTEIARRHGCRVVQRTFDNYAAQRNAALTEVDYKHDWILMVDADERWGSELYDGMRKAIAEHGERAAMFLFTRRDYFMGRCLKHSIASSTWAGRLVRKGRVKVIREINEEYHPDGEKVFLPLRFEHHPFNKGIAWWFDRHNRYSTMEALALLEEVKQPLRGRDLLAGDATHRRKALKQLAYRLPFRPFFVFCYLYFIRLGLLDGIPGFRYCVMRSMYEYMIDLKVAEHRLRLKLGEGEML